MIFTVLCMLHSPLVTVQPTSTFKSRVTNSNTGAEAPWSPSYPSIEGFNAYYGSLEEGKQAGRHAWHSCTHYVRKNTRLQQILYGCKSMVSYPSVNPYWIWHSTEPEFFWYNGVFTGHGYYHFGTLTQPFQGLSLLFDESTQTPSKDSVPADLSDLITRSVRTMWPGIRNNLSLPNSIYELKDFKKLPKLVLQIKSAVESIHKLAKPGHRSRTLKNIAKAGAGAYLNNEFNLAPLMSDIVSVMSSLTDTRRQLNQLLMGAGKRQKSHFKTSFDATRHFDDYDYRPVTSQPNWLVWPTSIASFRDMKYSTRQFSATMEYSYTLPEASSFGREVDALLDNLGVNLNPAIIWNAIPWSFVVDWVLGVSRYLEGFKIRNIEPAVSIHRYCYSVKIERTTKVGFVFHGTPYPIFQAEEKSYRRFVDGLDLVNTSIQSSGLNLKESSFAIALGVSRL